MFVGVPTITPPAAGAIRIIGSPGKSPAFGLVIPICASVIGSWGRVLTNELRFGYALNIVSTLPHEPITDAQIGITRPNAGDLPGLPMIRIAPAAGGVIVGTPTNINPAKPSVTTLADSLSFLRRNHTLRTGLEIRFDEVTFTGQIFTRGQIDFLDFRRFLAVTH